MESVRDPRVAALARLALLIPARPDLGPFFLDRFEVTQGEYDRFLRAGQAPAGFEEEPASAAEEERPVSGVTPLQARDYARWRGMRLPTLAEWEWAVGNRGAEDDALPWGRGFDSSRLDHLKCNTAELGLGRPISVGTFELGATRDARGRRIYDLVGNVAEWVRLPPGHPVDGIEDRRIPPPGRAPRALRAARIEETPEDQARLAFVLSTAEALLFHAQLALAERAGGGRIPDLLGPLGRRLVPLAPETWTESSLSTPFTTADALRFGFGLTTAEAALFHFQVEWTERALGPWSPPGLSLLAALLVPPILEQPGAQLLKALTWFQADLERAWWDNLAPEEGIRFHLGLDLARRAAGPWFPDSLIGLAHQLVPWPSWEELFHRRFQCTTEEALGFRFRARMADRALGAWGSPLLESLAASLVPLGLSDRETLQRPWAWAGWSHASLMEWVKQPIPDRVSQRKGFSEAASTVGFRCAASAIDLLAWLAGPEGPSLDGAEGRAVAAFLQESRSLFQAALPDLPRQAAVAGRREWIQRLLD